MPVNPIIKANAADYGVVEYYDHFDNIKGQALIINNCNFKNEKENSSKYEAIKHLSYQCFLVGVPKRANRLAHSTSERHSRRGMNTLGSRIPSVIS